MYEERAAIKEYDGNIPREEAERQARAEVDAEKRKYLTKMMRGF